MTVKFVAVLADKFQLTQNERGYVLRQRFIGGILYIAWFTRVRYNKVILYPQYGR